MTGCRLFFIQRAGCPWHLWSCTRVMKIPNTELAPHCFGPSATHATGPQCHSDIEYTTFHLYELWLYIFYIITDIESIGILIKGSEYWVGAPTAHQLSPPQEVDSHNPCEESNHPSKVCDTERKRLKCLEARQIPRITLKVSVGRTNVNREHNFAEERCKMCLLDK